MKQIVNLIILIVLGVVIMFTTIFALLQLKRSQAIDDRLVSSLTTQLETALIQQVITKIAAPVD